MRRNLKRSYDLPQAVSRLALRRKATQRTLTPDLPGVGKLDRGRIVALADLAHHNRQRRERTAGDRRCRLRTAVSNPASIQRQPTLLAGYLVKAQKGAAGAGRPAFSPATRQPTLGAPRRLDTPESRFGGDRHNKIPESRRR